MEGDLLWNAGRTSSFYIEEKANELVQGKDVLEIGAAAGVPSIVSTIKGARTVVMTDYPDPDLVDIMRQNASLSVSMFPKQESPSLHVEGYKWGNSVDSLLSYLPSGEKDGFDLLIMADVIYSHREHTNLIKTMKQTLKRNQESVALVVFTPYQPWLLPKIANFFPLAEQSGFQVSKVFEKVVDKVLFANDPGVCSIAYCGAFFFFFFFCRCRAGYANIGFLDRMKNFDVQYSGMSYDGQGTNSSIDWNSHSG